MEGEPPSSCRTFAAVIRAVAACTALGSPFSLASTLNAQDELSLLKRLPLDQLVDTEITSVSRRPEPLSLAASAVDVITGEEIRRSGVTNIPDALRLGTGIHVAQIDGHTWAISTRGFNSAAANKLQVLMDGRSIYTPLYSGVFWDVQHTFMPDLEQIEVIRGPGATLWGSNAVNGVINIRTKSAKDTQGILLQGGGGSGERGFGGVRYGGKVGATYYRAYVTHLNRDALPLEQGGFDSGDDFNLTQGGFRIDSELSADDLLTFQGDIYRGRFAQSTLPPTDVEAEGGNAIARWSRQLAPDSSMTLQAYFDRTHRILPGVFEEDRTTYDLDWQHGFTLSGIHDILWGLNARASEDQIGNLGPGLAFLPDSETLFLAGGFLQDEIHFIPKRFSVTLGSKFEYNNFSGFEVQPSARFAITPTESQTIWGAISRAVRTPTRIDQDLFAPNPAFATPTILQGNRGFDSEVLIAYELGYRVKPARNLALDLALFYNDYDRLRSIEPIGITPMPVIFDNLLEGESYGAELGIKWQPASWWTIDLGYTLMQTHFHRKHGSRDLGEGVVEGNDPNHILVAHSSFDLPGNVEFDVIVRYVDRLPAPVTPAYLTLDLRLAWEPVHGLELAVVGRNLLDPEHPEYRRTTGTREVPRSVFGTVTWRF